MEAGRAERKETLLFYFHLPDVRTNIHTYTSTHIPRKDHQLSIWTAQSPKSSTAKKSVDFKVHYNQVIDHSFSHYTEMTNFPYETEVNLAVCRAIQNLFKFFIDIGVEFNSHVWIAILNFTF